VIVLGKFWRICANSRKMQTTKVLPIFSNHELKRLLLMNKNSKIIPMTSILNP
jgi:hypothetical protein